MELGIRLSGTVVVRHETGDAGLSQQILSLLHIIKHQEELIMATLADIQAKVAAEQTVEASAIALLQSLSADLKAALAANDSVALQAIADGLDTNAAALAAAVAANTPAAPASVPPAPIP